MGGAYSNKKSPRAKNNQKTILKKKRKRMLEKRIMKMARQLCSLATGDKDNDTSEMNKTCKTKPPSGAQRGEETTALN